MGGPYGSACPSRGKLFETGLLQDQVYFGWKPRWHIEEAIGQTVAWTKVYFEKAIFPGRWTGRSMFFVEASNE